MHAADRARRALPQADRYRLATGILLWRAFVAGLEPDSHATAARLAEEHGVAEEFALLDDGRLGVWWVEREVVRMKKGKVKA